jgi:hypothetical protein
MTENPKSETRNPIALAERAWATAQRAAAASLSDFGLRSSFGLRYSGFGFHAPRLPFNRA